MAKIGQAGCETPFKRDINQIRTIDNQTTILWKTSHFFEHMAVYLCVISVGMLCLDLILAVVSRYVFQTPIIVADEIALFLLTWITFLGASLSVKRNELVAVSFFVERLGQYYWFSQLLIQVVILLFSLLLLGYGYIWVTSPDAISTQASASQIFMWVPYSIFPFSMFITVIFSLGNIEKIWRENHKVENRS